MFFVYNPRVQRRLIFLITDKNYHKSSPNGKLIVSLTCHCLPRRVIVAAAAA